MVASARRVKASDWSVLRRPLDPIDNEGFNRPPRRFQSQAELLLHGRKQIQLWMLRVCRRQVPAKLGFVGRPLQIEIVSSRKAGLIHHRTSSADRCITQPSSRMVALRAASRAQSGERTNTSGGDPSGDVSAAASVSLSPLFASVSA